MLDLKLDEIEQLLCSANPGVEFLLAFSAQCKSRVTNFETWLEICFLRQVIENKGDNLLHIAHNLSYIDNGEDVREVFYNIILSSFSKNNNRNFIYKILERPPAFKYIYKFLAKLPIADVPKLITRLHQNDVIPDFALYLALFGEKEFVSIDKFTILFDGCDVDLKQRIVLGGFVVNDYSFISRLNSYFQESPITFHNFSNYLYDNGIILKALVTNISTSSLNHSLDTFRDFLFANPDRFPITIEELLIKAIKENTSSFILQAGMSLPKREILALLTEYKATTIVNQFLTKFGDDPEIEQFIAFA